MTSVVISGSDVSVVHGRLDGRSFRVEDEIHRSGPDGVGGFVDVGRRFKGPACLCLPRDRTLVRHFRVPAESESEIEAMLPHLLAGELPQAVERFSWAWSQVPDRDDGFTIVTVFLARNDQLEAYLAPVADVGLNVVTLIPEGWGWARVLGLVGGTGIAGDEPVNQTFVIQREGAPYLVVEREGQLLYDEILPAGDSLDWDGPAVAGVRQSFEDLYGVPLARPQAWLGTGPVDGAGYGSDNSFAAAVAAIGLDCPRALLPPARLRQSRRRTFLRAAAGLARLGVVAAVIWLAFTVFAEGRTRRHLDDLERQLAEQAPRVAVLEAESAAIRESRGERAAGTEILQAVASLRRHVKAPIHLEHLNYVQGRGLTLRGGAPANADVLEMLEQLSTDPLWRSLRVMQLRSETVGGADRVHFIVEGRMN